MNNLPSRLPSLTTILWVLASLVAIGAFLFIAPNLINPPAPPSTPSTAVAVHATASPTSTVENTATPIPAAPPPREVTSEPLPTAPTGAVVYSSVADPTRSGYIKTNDDKAHWGDRNLHAGFFGNEHYSGVLFFDISAIPPNSNFLSAQLDLTGLSRDNLGPEGEWRASLIRLPAFEEWETLKPEDFANATVVTSLGNPLSPADLDLGRTNQIDVSADQLPGIVNEIGEHTYLIVRLDGPEGPDNSLFTWDSGGLDLKTGAHPMLTITAEPGQFVVVTNTPTAESVVTAAAIALRETDAATSVGTVTPFPRNYATATPIIHVTREPTAENVETRVAIAQIATAVAITTGTYTPTPENWIVVNATFTPLPTRTPQLIAAATLYARLTPTAPPTRTPTVRELLLRPLPDFLKGNLLVVTDRFIDEYVAVMRPDGTITEGLTGKDYYELAQVREQFSPDRSELAIVAPDDRDILQIWIEDQNTGARRPLTHIGRGLAYDPVWSPEGGRIAFVSRETGNDEIYVYDLGTQNITQLTTGGNPFIYKQKPTWSPDGSQIAFKANDGTLNFQIWVMNADGSNLHNISQSTSNDRDPIWVK